MQNIQEYHELFEFYKNKNEFIFSKIQNYFEFYKNLETLKLNIKSFENSINIITIELKEKINQLQYKIEKFIDYNDIKTINLNKNKEIKNLLKEYIETKNIFLFYLENKNKNLDILKSDITYKLYTIIFENNLLELKQKNQCIEIIESIEKLFLNLFEYNNNIIEINKKTKELKNILSFISLLTYNEIKLETKTEDINKYLIELRIIKKILKKEKN